MKSEEMKRKKFEILVKDIDEYLGRTGVSDSYRVIGDMEENYELISPLEFFIEKNEKNHWLTTIFNNTFIKRGVAFNYVETGTCVELADIEKNNIMELVVRIRKCNECPHTRYNNSAHCNIAYHLLFWLIFAISVDNENYNNNLSVVSDVAYVLNFDEAMLKDWITAVKGVLSGNKLSELEYKTKVGKAFFVR